MGFFNKLKEGLSKTKNYFGVAYEQANFYDVAYFYYE